MKAPLPKRSLQFLRWFCREDYLEEIEGDLAEIFQKQYESSPSKAKWKYTWSVVTYFRPGFLKAFKKNEHNTYSMYGSYFKVGWRNLLRNKGYSLINISGLALGMTVAMLNGLWVWDEFSFNRNFENYDRVAKIAETRLDREHGGLGLGTTTTYALSNELINNYAQHFERIERASFYSNSILSHNDVNFAATGMYVTGGFTEMFSFEMIEGTRSGLATKNAILISQSLAEKFFETSEAVNRALRLNNKLDVIVAGVFEDFPLNSEFSGVQFFTTWDLFLEQNRWIEERALNDLRNHFIKMYVQLHPGASLEAVNLKVMNALQFDPADSARAKSEQAKLYLYPMSDWHMKPASGLRGYYPPMTMVKMVGAIGAFVLLLACINFMNLSTARSINRAKEVGIRKTVGSIRSQLVNQFFTESFLVVSVAFIFALLLTFLFLPLFNNIAGKQIEIPWSVSWFWIANVTFIVVTSTVAGSYPALYLSSFNPVKVLKGTFRTGRFAFLPRKVLVVFQFSISVVLIIGTMLVYQQIQYAKSRPVGYDREGLLMIQKKTGDFYGKYDVIRNELLSTGVVTEVSESMGPVTEVYSGNNGWEWKGKGPDVDDNFATLAVSHTHGSTVGWQFVDGRDFDLSKPADSSGIVINETAAKLMGLQHPVGESLTWTWWSDKSKVIDYTILGVIRDVVMESPYENVEPTVFYLKGHNGTTSWIHIRLKPQVPYAEAIAKIESVFKKIIPSAPFEFSFVDEAYSTKFAREEQIGTLALVFAILAIFISCLGLLGLASFVAEQRTREMAIRKVLGASVASLWQMLSRDFMLLILIACLVASPVAYYFMSGWLQKFVYHTEISVWTFVLTGIAAIVVTLLTVSFQAIKTAMQNPVISLKSE